MAQLNIFDDSVYLGAKNAQGKICKNCIHLARNNYNSNIKYCRKSFSKSNSGLKRIKSNDIACFRYEEKPKEIKQKIDITPDKNLPF